eukprot:6049732-Pyramimonas_sp.AAC.1
MGQDFLPMNRIVISRGKDCTPMGHQSCSRRFRGGARGPVLVQGAEKLSPPPHKIPPSSKSHQPPPPLGPPPPPPGYYDPTPPALPQTIAPSRSAPECGGRQDQRTRRRRRRREAEER